MNKRTFHLGDEMLLRYIDGELGRRARAKTKEHLAACWSCRVHLEEIESAISSVVQFQDALVSRQRPSSGTLRTLLSARIDELGGRAKPHFLWYVRNLPEWVTIRPMKPKWLALSALLMMASVFLLVHLRDVPKVSANELLRRAAASEQSLLHMTTHPVVRQTVRIQQGSRSVTRTIYRDPAGKRYAERSDMPKDDLLCNLFELAGVSWEEPLSVQNYEEWRRSLRQARDEVNLAKLSDGSTALRLKTFSEDKPVVDSVSVLEGTLLVRESDWHPVQRTFRLGRNTEMRDFACTELEFEVLSLEKVRGQLFPDVVPRGPTATERENSGHSDPRAKANRYVWPPSLLEVEALYRLHRTGACLGEDIEVSQTRDGIGVAGRIDHEERKRELLMALGDLPLAQVELQVEGKPMGSSIGGQPLSSKADSLQAGPSSFPVEWILEKHFLTHSTEGEGQTAALALRDSSLASLRMALREAWALRRLAKRFDANAIEALPERSVLLVERMASDHQHELSKRLSIVFQSLEPLFRNLSVRKKSFALVTTREMEWRGRSLELVTEVERVDRLGWELFGGPDATEEILSEAATELQARLSRLNQDFLEGTEVRLERQAVAAGPPQKK
ncbi:MAG: hypothetical protein L0387_14235 [Acidobacteria bacterium]|nr:hypothetical protein [Acidobacteriota bacterium]MCI0721865.1 hypothetical protein [Acidobacteriota bacterium]